MQQLDIKKVQQILSLREIVNVTQENFQIFGLNDHGYTLDIVTYRPS